MGYQGDSLATMFEKAKEPTRAAARNMADAAGKRMVTRVKENTPVERFLKDLAHPRHLRDSITEKQMVVISGSDPIYETGAETDVIYAPYVEHGTGLWGPEHRKYEIRPKNPNGWLSWIATKAYVRRDGTTVHAGDRVFAKKVMHPGSPGAHMFAIGVEMTAHEFDEFTKPVLEEWARKVTA